MPALYIMIPAALLLVGVAIYVFFWAVDSGQYDDMEGPAHSVLFDDPPAIDQAEAQRPEPEPTRSPMLELAPLLLSALILGLLGGGHCLGMCGGLMGALTLAIPENSAAVGFVCC